jgi:hypothetical protein
VLELRGSVSESDGQLSLEIGSETTAVTVVPVPQTGLPVDVFLAVIVRTPSPVMLAALVPPGATETVVGLAGSSVGQSPYQTAYPDVKGKRLTVVVDDPAAIAVSQVSPELNVIPVLLRETGVPVATGTLPLAANETVPAWS